VLKTLQWSKSFVLGSDEKKYRRIDIKYVTDLLYSIYGMFFIKTYIKSEGKSTRKMFDQGLDLILSGLMSRDEYYSQG
jgi:hypothetical protein